MPCFIKRDEKKTDERGIYTGSRYPGVTYKTKEVWFPGAHYDIANQYFKFGANFEEEDIIKKEEKVITKLHSILLEKNKNVSGVHNALDVANSKVPLSIINFELGEFVEKVLRHYLNTAKSIKIEPNSVYADKVYNWIFEKIRETSENSIAITKRNRVPHEKPRQGTILLKGDVYEKLLREFDLFCLKDIILKDRVIQPWTLKENIKQIKVHESGYKSRTLLRYKLISNSNEFSAQELELKLQSLEQRFNELQTRYSELIINGG